MTTPPLDDKLLRLAVTIGRFQVATLHYGHRRLLYECLAQADKVLVLLGTPVGGRCDKRNPLDYATRKAMFVTEFNHDPRIGIEPIYDVATRDDLWSAEVDEHIDDYIRYLTSHDVTAPVIVTMCGGRDSFLKNYIGRYKSRSFELAQVGSISGTENRARVARAPLNNSDFRAGIIYAYENM